jgi:arginyl-tRNA synthetase
MTSIKKQWKTAVSAALNELAIPAGVQIESSLLEALSVETPPRAELGDLAIPLFSLAKVFRRAPAQLARHAAGLLESSRERPAGTVIPEGPYLNIFLDKTALTTAVRTEIKAKGERYGWSGELVGRKVMVEFSCPNTNKPLHLGHLRNDALGESIARILAAAGAEVRKVNLINDRGIHICKSMLAYMEFGQGRGPQQAGRKSDHYVGDFYVKYNAWAAENPGAEEKARELLRKWEDGDPATLELWQTMNEWAIEGIKATYCRTGIAFDAYYLESRTYTEGRAAVLKGVEQGIFQREEDGSVQVDLAGIKLDKKVLLRSDGTSLYLTQDIGTAIARHRDWPFDRLIYVVASEQRYHFQVLFHVLAMLGQPWAQNLQHLSYGMVNLPEGRMKSREGTVVDADELLDELTAMAVQEIREKEREDQLVDLEATAASIALGAVHYYLLQTIPSKDMVFNPKESLSFTGNTGPYLQYMGARLSSMLRKHARMGKPEERPAFDASLLRVDGEWELVKLIAAFPEIVIQAAQSCNPSLVANHLYELCKVFSSYYHDTPILHNEHQDLVEARVELSRMVLQTLKNGLALLNIPFLEAM